MGCSTSPCDRKPLAIQRVYFSILKIRVSICFKGAVFNMGYFVLRLNVYGIIQINLGLFLYLLLLLIVVGRISQSLQCSFGNAKILDINTTKQTPNVYSCSPVDITSEIQLAYMIKNVSKSEIFTCEMFLSDGFILLYFVLMLVDTGASAS